MEIRGGATKGGKDSCMKIKYILWTLTTVFMLQWTAGSGYSGTIYTYDQGNRLIEVQTQDCSYTFIKYDPSGARVKVERKIGRWLDHVEIVGSPILDEYSSAVYTLNAHYRYGMEEGAPGSGEWSENAPYVAFDPGAAGKLDAGEVDAHRVVQIEVDYDGCPTARTGSYNIVIKDSGSGPVELCEESAARIIRNYRIISCFSSLAAAYDAAVEGDVIQAQMNPDGMAFEFDKEKEVGLEGYKDPGFLSKKVLEIDNVEISEGALIIK